jgi:hypothetical protein
VNEADLFRAYGIATGTSIACRACGGRIHVDDLEPGTVRQAVLVHNELHDRLNLVDNRLAHSTRLPVGSNR